MSTKVVALGGGHGLYTSLSALRAVTGDLTAVVTVADDGGSSGRLRADMGIVPPGDLRMALSALCDDGEWGTMWRDVLQTRFAGEGALAGHALGNLIIAGLWDKTGDVVDGLDWVARLLRAQGRVLPLASEPLEIWASIGDEQQVVRGQVAVATARGTVRSVGILPENPAVPEATVAAIDDAAAVILGPGSWYTSVLVHFLVEPVARALVEAGDRTILTLNIAYEDQETAGTDRVDDVLALRALAPAFVPAVVLADRSHGEDSRLKQVVADWGCELVVADLKDAGSVDRHDVDKLASAYSSLLEGLVSGNTFRPGMAG